MTTVTVLEHLRVINSATMARRKAGHAMTYAAGQELIRYAPDLVHLAEVVGDYLAGDAPKAALLGAFRPMLAAVEERRTAREATGA